MTDDQHEQVSQAARAAEIVVLAICEGDGALAVAAMMEALSALSSPIDIPGFAVVLQKIVVLHRLNRDRYLQFKAELHAAHTADEALAKAARPPETPPCH